MKKFLLTIPALIAVFVFALLVMRPTTVKASFNSSDIIDNYNFDNVGTMTASQIDTFLNTFPSSCISWNNGFQAPDPTGYSPSGGFTYGGNVTAGQVIYDSAQTYGLNPQVLITTLQKEQSLVTGSSGCSTAQYVGAMGYGCPDGGTAYSYSGVDLYTIHGQTVTSVGDTCVNTSSKAGFSQQVIHAAWLLRFGEQRSEGNVGWDVQLTNAPESGDSWNNSDDPQSCYSGPMTEGTWQTCPSGSSVFYDGYTTIDGTSTYISDGATAALYWYTPHFAGNENFDTIYQSWFGPTTGQGFQLAVPDNCSSGCPQYVVYNNMKQYVPSSQIIYAWGLQNVPLTTMPAAELNAIPTGPNLGRLMGLAGTTSVYFADGGKRYLIPWQSTFNVWNFAGQVTSYVSDQLFTTPSYAGFLSFDVQAPGSSTVYMLDGGDNNGQTILRPFANTAIFQAWEGQAATPTVLDANSGYFSQIDNDIGGTLSSTFGSFDGDNFQVMSGLLLQEPSNLTSLFPGMTMCVSAATYGRLVPSGTISPVLQVAGQSSIYLMDNGTLHLLSSPNEVTAWEPPSQPVIEVPSSYFDLFSVGSSINGYLSDTGGQLTIVSDGITQNVPASLTTAYGNISSTYDASSALLALYYHQSQNATSFIQPLNSPNIYLLNNSSKLMQFSSSAAVTSWGGYATGITELPDYVVNSIPATNSPATFVTDGTNNYIMDNGEKWTISSGVQAKWGISNPQSFTDGTLSLFPTGGAVGTTGRDGVDNWYMVANGSAYVTSDPSIANLWGLSNAPIHSLGMTSQLMPVWELQRFVSWNNQLYVVDAGNWYSITPAVAANLGEQSQPVMILNPDAAPNSITSWTSYMVTDGIGDYWVIDNGTKRQAPTSAIINQWDDNGGISVPAVTNGTLNEMPSGPNIAMSIKTNDSPSIYVVSDGQLSHILYSNTYWQYYAPYTIVSDQLVNSLPAGPNIN